MNATELHEFEAVCSTAEEAMAEVLALRAENARLKEALTDLVDGSDWHSGNLELINKALVVLGRPVHQTRMVPALATCGCVKVCNPASLREDEYCVNLPQTGTEQNEKSQLGAPVSRTI